MSKLERGLSKSQRSELWRRWKLGETITEIGEALEKAPGSIHGFLSGCGGIAPPSRRRRPNALTLEEREEISRGIVAGYSLHAISISLARSVSTLSREVARNGGRSRYRAAEAETKAWRRALRPKRCKLAEHAALRRVVAHKLRRNWSPEQTAGWLKRTYPDDDSMQVSHETIYRSLYVQARGVLKKELAAHLRSRRKLRRSKQSTTKGQPRGRIIDAVSISERPASVEDRAIPGHWEGDMISGSNNSHIATLVERQTRFTMLVKLDGKDAKTVAAALSREVGKLPIRLRKSLTWDRGTEMALHKRFSAATSVKVYFCDPQSPWQRGTNENTNRLLRQYFPKKTELGNYTQRALNRVAQELNERPRKTLGFETPAEKLAAVLR
jgi:IS30 family transposase